MSLLRSWSLAASKKSSFVVKNACHASQFVGGGGSRERKGFMVKVSWAGQEQQEYEVVRQLPGY